MLERDKGKYGNHDESNGSRGETSGIIAYLAQLGLGDIDLDKVDSLVTRPV